MNLVPIKVKIGLRPNGHADHPDWYKLPLAAEMEPSTQMCDGWHYDKSCGHKESGVDSPIGMQWGMLFVTPRFATEAKSVFPGLITELTPGEAEIFWNTKVTAHMPENDINTTILQGLQSEIALRKELGQITEVAALKIKLARVLNPEDAEPGININRTKAFQNAKVVLGINLISSITTK